MDETFETYEIKNRFPVEGSSSKRCKKDSSLLPLFLSNWYLLYCTVVCSTFSPSTCPCSFGLRRHFRVAFQAADVTSRLMIEDEVFGVNLPLLGRIVHALIGQTTTTTKRTETLQTRTDSRTSSLPPPKPDTGDKGAFGSALSILGFLLTLILLYCFPMSS